MKVTKFSCNFIRSLLMKAINQAKSFVTVSKKKVNAVIHFLKTPLVCNDSAWLNEQRDIYLMNLTLLWVALIALRF